MVLPDDRVLREHRIRRARRRQLHAAELARSLARRRAAELERRPRCGNPGVPAETRGRIGGAVEPVPVVVPAVLPLLQVPVTATFGLIAVFACFAVAYDLGKRFRQEAVVSASMATVPSSASSASHGNTRVI